MANTDSPFGLRLASGGNSSTFSGSTSKYYIPAGYATALFIGEAVTITGTANTGEVITGSGKYSAGSLPEINKTAAGDANAITGVIVGFDADPNNLENVYSAASTEGVAVVCDDPSAVFEIQADSAGDLAATSVGLNAVLIDTHAGRTNTGLAGTELDTTSDAPAGDASNQLTILSFVDRPDNEIGTHAKVLVRINNHTNAHGALGI